MTVSPAARVLVVDNDPAVAEVIARYLERDGHEVQCAGDDVLNSIDPPDLLILDMNRLAVGRKLRARWPVPVIILGEAIDLVDLDPDADADDYVTKPFSPRELALRVAAVLRRARGSIVPAGTGVLHDADLVVDVGARHVLLGDAEVTLTAREFDLLVYLLRNPRQAFSRTDLLDRVWGWAFGDSSTVTVHVRRLREKIEHDPTDPSRIITVWGVGYRYEPVS
ncbi:response regulator transcription factor [Herbidospora mongoliensis]|uniref:response regulator transcription factor n=1 Tax=Herbidospora mongoliensis TaxID=688067 RepID=UPI000830BAD7|nr:response regulator transcription factor [Herbidospora mongoliensis]